MRRLIAVCAVLFCASAVLADSGKLTVDVGHPGIKINPMLYGMMTEEINHSYDGGLYAELIQNRIFKDATRPAHWSVITGQDAKAAIALDENDPVNKLALSRSLRLDVTAPGQRAGIANDGYWGIPVWPKTQYKASFYAKAAAGFSGALTVDIETVDGAKVLASATVPSVGSEWKRYEVSLSSGDGEASAANRFVISTQSAGTVWFSLVSLFPPTYHDRANGNRIDLMEKMADLHPAFLRLPGGNYLEGNTIAERFEWKNTIGTLEEREGHRGPWGYRSTDGLGIVEFFDWCEDLKVEPVLAVFAGYALRGEHIAAGDKLTPFVQDALDEIEYASGDQTTRWGKRRAGDGHPEPFQFKYVEIGNEDWFDKSGSYDGRFAQFYDAIKAKYPQLQLIATAAVKSRTPDVMDDHYYRSARAMERDVHHYDKTSRTGPKIFVGEWATEEGQPTPDMNAALGDAAWITGMERNSDVIVMSCYAPLFVNVNRGARQWPTNLIGYDAAGSFGSPSYYAQKMLYENRGDTVLPVDLVQSPMDPAAEPAPRGAVGIGTWQTVAEFKDVKVQGGEKVFYESDFSKGVEDWRARGGNWSVQDGAYRQTGNQEDVRATTGDNAWGDYTYSLKARKISGSEGFLIMFHVQSRNDYFWWNLGGWGNTRSALERATDGAKEELGESQSVTIETGKWYDIRVELEGHEIKGYLDDKLIMQTTEIAAPREALAATASREDSSGNVILKVVNTTTTPQTCTVRLDGAGEIAGKATVDVLSGKPTDVNTVTEPKKIYPVRSEMDTSREFPHEFPACSVTVMRFSVK